MTSVNATVASAQQNHRNGADFQAPDDNAARPKRKRNPNVRLNDLDDAPPRPRKTAQSPAAKPSPISPRPEQPARSLAFPPVPEADLDELADAEFHDLLEDFAPQRDVAVNANLGSATTEHGGGPLAASDPLFRGFLLDYLASCDPAASYQHAFSALGTQPPRLALQELKAALHADPKRTHLRAFVDNFVSRPESHAQLQGAVSVLRQDKQWNLAIDVDRAAARACGTAKRGRAAHHCASLAYTAFAGPLELFHLSLEALTSAQGLSSLDEAGRMLRAQAHLQRRIQAIW